MSMLEILIELVISISICGMAAYFFLSVPMEERSVGEGDGDMNNNGVGNGSGNNGGNYNQRSTLTLERSHKCEGAMWCNVLGRWVAFLLLGGGSIDKDVWTDRIAYFVDRAARQVAEVLRRKQEGNGKGREEVERTLRVRPEMIRLVRIELSGGGPLSTVMNQQQQQQQQQSHQQQQQTYGSAQQGGLVNGLHHTRTSSDSARVGGLFTEILEAGGVATSPLIGVVLPRIGPSGIISLEAPYNPANAHDNSLDSIPPVMPMNSNSLRCFAVPIIYEDHRFALQFACYFPLLFALPATLSIPSDVLTLHCALSVRRIVFHATLYAAFCGNKVELSFTSEPQFTALYDVAPVKRRQHHPAAAAASQQQQQQFQPSSGNSAQVNLPVDMNTTLPPLAPVVGSGAASVTQRSREKLREIVDLAVKRAVQSITYPCVLQGKMRSPGKEINNDNGIMTWTLEKASLPLHCGGMKVYCRFAPPHAFVSTTDVDRDESDLQTSSWIAPTMVLLSLRKSGNEQQQTFTVTDPLSGSMASSTCQRVFIPRSMTASAVGTTSLNSSSGQEEDQQQKQQKGVFDEVVRPFLHDLIIGKRCMFLAYGQTATGKTYTMFGPGVDDNIYELQRRQRLASNKRAGLITREETCEEEEEEEEGMVPRFLRAIFDKSCIEVYGRSVDFVDLSCLEVYNECTTDLVALQFQQQLQQQQQRRKTHTSKKKNGKPSSPVLDDMESDNIRRAWMRYENGGLGGGSGMRKISYKSTEKSQVLRGAMRLRCASAVECWRLLCGVLALRHRSQTERNVRSSRSHLLLRLVLHSTDVTTGMVDPLGEAMFVDLAGSETYREYAWIGMGNSNSNNNNNNNNINNSNNNSYNNLNSTSSNTSVVVEHDGAVASPLLPTSTVDVPLVASTFNATRRDGDGLTAAERNSLRIKEMRHINSSLLALRKVVRALRTTSLTTRVPFRDSALTTILEPFLVPDGSATVAWIVCCSSRQRDFHETVESLRLGAEASAIPAHVQLAPIVLPTSTINRNTSNINNNNIHINSVSGTNSSAEGFSGERALSSRGVYTQPVVSSSLLSSAAAVATNISGREISNEKRRGNTVSGAVIQRSGRNSNNSSIMNSSNHIPGTASHYMNDCSDADKSKEKENKNEEDVEVYKQYAWQLLEQCKTLCERYDECVEELARAKQIITTKDREIAELRKLLATAEVQKDPQQQAKQQQQQQQQNKNKNKNKEEEEIEEELSKEESNVISTAPTLLPSSHSVSPGEHSTPVPPAWLRKSAVRLNHNDISLALPHLSFTAEPTGETKVKEEKEKKEVKPVNMEGSVHKDAETSETHGDSNSNNNAVENDGYDKGAVDLIDSILHRYCVHHDPLQDMNDRSSNNNNNTIQNDTMKNIERTPAGVLESKGCDNISVFTTPAEALLDTKMSVCTDAFAGLKVNTRRERLVSFVSPSSHGAVPLLKLEEELHPPHIIPPPPMRSSLCTNVMPSLGEVLQNQRQKQKPLQKEEVTKTKDTEVPGKGNSLVADENIAAGILQQLISRSAAFTETVPE